MSHPPIVWNSVTALFGGTFDPPHSGHLEAIEGLFSHPGISRLVVLPSADPPHKPGVTPSSYRIEMARLALEPLQAHLPIEVDCREITRARSTGRPSYSFETLQELRAERGSALAFVIGVDQLESLHSWYRFPEVLGLCHWIVLERKPDGETRARKAIAELSASGLLQPAGDRRWVIHAPSSAAAHPQLTLVPTEARRVSSRELRELLQKTGQAPQDALPEPVFRYLKTHRLYGSHQAK